MCQGRALRSAETTCKVDVRDAQSRELEDAWSSHVRSVLKVVVSLDLDTLCTHNDLSSSQLYLFPLSILAVALKLC